jgi:hypothetical protein
VLNLRRPVKIASSLAPIRAAVVAAMSSLIATVAHELDVRRTIASSSDLLSILVEAAAPSHLNASGTHTGDARRTWTAGSGWSEKWFRQLIHGYWGQRISGAIVIADADRCFKRLTALRNTARASHQPPAVPRRSPAQRGRR